MERKLATIAKILDIRPIPGADAIEVATVRGWSVVIRKGEFSVGDMCVYLEVDSFLPMKPEFEFLRKMSFKKMGDVEGFRLKTVRLRKQISQGLCLPLSVLPGYTTHEFNHLYSSDTTSSFLIIQEGMDVTADLGIVKYEPPIPAELAGVVKGPFPGFIPQTDEERIQNVPFILDRLKDVTCYVSEKVDGASFTAFINDGQFGICSRNLELAESETNTFWRVAREMKLEEKMRSKFSPRPDFPGVNICLQGELLGEGVQKNKYKLKGQRVLFFNARRIGGLTRDEAYDSNFTAYWYNFADFVALIGGLGLETVPIVDTGFKVLPTVEEMLTYADGKSLLNPSHNREGVVVRPLTEAFDGDMPHLGRVSFKVISNKFLLDNED